MRSAYAALVLGSLMLQKDLSGGPPLRSRTAREADGKEGPAGPCPEGSLLSPFQHMLCSRGFCWISETTWGFPLAWAVLLLLWLGFEIWTSSCLARWQAQRRRPIATESHAAAQSSSPPLPEAAYEGEREDDFSATQAKHSSSICGRQPTSDFESYDLPCQVHRHPYYPHQTPRSVCQDENLHQKYQPCPPPLLRTTMIRPKHSSSSSSSSSCLPLLKHLNLHCHVATEASWATPDSSDTSETSSSDSSSSESDDLYFLKKRKQRGPSFFPLFPERLPEIKSTPLLPESHPEIKGVPQMSFAQISFVQNSTFEKEDRVILMEKSLEIRMGPLPAPTATTSLPGLRIGDKEEAGEKPSPLPLLDQMAIQCLDFRVKEQKEELAKTREKSATQPSSQKEEEAAQPKATAGPAGSKPPDSEEAPTVLKAMDEKSKNVLDFHIKKKMVQRRCGVPTVVINSVNLFQSLKKKSFRGDLKKPMQNILLNAEAPARPPLLPRNALAVYMKSFQESPRANGYYIFHKANPEEIRKAGFPAPEKKLGLQTRDSQRSQRNYVLFSMEPEKLRKLLFHLTVKMVEIQKGAFPEMVENSLCTFSILSVKPLPKPIRFGNKISRPKDLSLAFVAKEALCIIDFNISHKYMVFTWGIPKPHSRPTEKATPALSEATQCPSGPVKEVPQKPPAPILVLKTPGKGASPPGGAASKQILLLPKPQAPRVIPLAPAKEPQDVQFTDLFKQSSLAPSMPSKRAKGLPLWSMAVLLRDVHTQERVEAEVPGEGIPPKKVALAVPSSESQGAVDKDSTSIKQAALGEKTTDGGIRTLKAANLQEELKDRPCSTDVPAPLKKGAKADGKEAGSKEDGDRQEGALHYSGLPPTTKKGAGNEKDGDELEGMMPYRAVPLSPEKGESERDGGRPAELEGTMRYTSTPEKRAGTGSKKDENPQAELEGTVHYRPLHTLSPEKGESKKDGGEQGDLEGTMRYRALPGTPKKGAATGSERDGGRPAELEGTMRYTSTTQTGAGIGSKKDGEHQGELEGTLHYSALPLAPEKGARDGDRPAELEGTMRYTSTTQTGAGTGSKKDGEHQGELEGTLHYSALPLAPEKGVRDGDRPAELEGTMRYSAIPQEAGQAEGERTAAGRARSARRFPARAAPSSPSPRGAAAGESQARAKSRGQADGKAAAEFKETRTSRKGRERAPRGDALALSLGVQAAGRQGDAPITRASLFLRLDLTKEKLNLHLEKRLEVALRPRQRAGLSLRVKTGAGKGRGPPPPRPFCYVCMDPERRGDALRTGCWALPHRILDMSGGRVPRVARLGEPRRSGTRRPPRGGLVAGH